MKFSIEELRPIRNGMTISRDSRLGNSTKVTYFSMGKDTSISQESYDRMRFDLSRCFSAKHYISENSVQNIRRADNPQRLRIIGSKVLFYL